MRVHSRESVTNGTMTLSPPDARLGVEKVRITDLIERGAENEVSNVFTDVLVFDVNMNVEHKRK